MTRSPGLAALLLILAGCATQPEIVSPSLPIATVPPTVRVGSHTAWCAGVDPPTSRDVAAQAIHNMAGLRPSDDLVVRSRPVYPPVQDWADGSERWQVYLPVGDGSTVACMVVARRPTLGGYGQVAGDQPGRSTIRGQPSGCPTGSS
jgi:hypothetical protein